MNSLGRMSSFDTIYKKNMQWGFYGSIAFEVILLLHRIMIFCTLALPSYGVIASMFSLIHLGTHIADAGATNSVVPLLSYFTRSKQYFRAMVLRHTLAVHLPLLVATTGVMMIFLRTHATIIALPGKVVIFGFLVFTESLRNFMRQFLYAVQHTQWVVVIELGLLVSRLAIVWGAYGVVAQPLTPFFIMMTHVAEMIVSVIVFICVVYRFYQALPDDHELFPSQHDWSFCRIKFFNYVLRLSRNLFSASFLTPFFAVYFGLATAGIFYFASKLATALLGVVKITIGYTGNGLLAAAKRVSVDAVNKVFGQLRRKLFFISLSLMGAFIVVGLVMNFLWYAEPLSWHIFILSFLFLMMSCFESGFILYECLYILEHRASILFVVKVVEILCFYAILYAFKATSPFFVLMSTVVLRAITLVLVGYRASRFLHDTPRSLLHIFQR